MRVVDLRSDTVTQPTPEMRLAMAEAEVGDDVSGEDPSANRLEALAAEMMGKEAGLFVSSGHMGNLVGALVHCGRGDEMIVGDKTHICNAEGGSAAAFGGITTHTLRNDERGMLDPDEVEAAIRPDDFHYPPTRMIALENTANACGGAVLTPEDTAAIGDVAKRHEVALHIDGARIFNSAVYLETPVSELVKDADTVTFCLSKGLSAPVGSVVCGTHEMIEQGRRWRKALGGGMRQVGVVAAAGIVALETMVERLAEDHANARKLAKGLSEVPGIEIDPDSLPTNLVFFTTTVKPLDEVIRRVEERGVRGLNERPKIRLVTHYGITSDDIDYALDVIDTTFREFATA